MVRVRSQGWLPASVIALRQYSSRTFVADLIAGVTVGLVALPLAMAFAISSGMTPQAGLYCAVVTGFLISALGGSIVQIGGPTGAFVVVVSGIIAEYGLDGLFMCTMMAGVLQAIQDFADALRQSGRTLLRCGAPPQPARLMSEAEFHRHVGAENILPNVGAALQRAEELQLERRG